MKRHILLVDDDEDDVAVFLAALKEIHVPCKCTWAKSGEQALKQLAYLTPDIIFLDINMPGMNGLECLAAIKQVRRLHHIPVVLHTTGQIPGLNEKGKNLGASCFLKKPASTLVLAEIIKKLIPEKRITVEHDPSGQSASHES